MKKILFLYILLTSVFATFAQETKTAQLSPEKLKLREELESDRTMLNVSCGQIYDPANIKMIEEENSRIRLLLYQASQIPNKTAKAKRNCATKEGTAVADYLLVENGDINYIADSSRDRFGKLTIEKYGCNKLIVGTYATQTKDGDTKIVFTPLEEKDLAGKVLSLQCKTENREFIF